MSEIEEKGQQEIRRGQGQSIKQKGVADVVFCLDASGSMSDVFSGLVDHIRDFIEGLKSNQQISELDLRLGIIAHDQNTFHMMDFTDDVNRFKDALKKISIGWDEYTLPALDWALDFDWRVATRIVVLFTDEPLSGGHDPSFQASKFDALIEKIIKLKVNLFFIGIDCPEYQKFGALPRAVAKLVQRSDRSIFSSYGFADLMNKMGKTLSVRLSDKEKAEKAEKDLYKIAGSINIINI